MKPTAETAFSFEKGTFATGSRSRPQRTVRMTWMRKSSAT